MLKPCLENPKFVQIGAWSDAPILIRRNSNDLQIYGAWVDECGDPDAPDIYAYSLDEYLFQSIFVIRRKTNLRPRSP